MKLILIGAQGAGKGTHASELSKRLKIPHLEAGEMLRHYSSQNTSLGRKLRSLLDKGMLVPEYITNRMIAHRLKKGDVRRGWILDGFPRSLGQARFLDKITDVDLVIELKITDAVAVKRISNRWMCPVDREIYGLNKVPKKKGYCDKHKARLYRRDDDTPKAIRKRLAIYHKVTAPVVKYFGKRRILRRVDAGQKQEAVFRDILLVVIK